MKMYETMIVNKSKESAQIPEQLSGGAYFTIRPGDKTTIKNTDVRNYMSAFEKITINGEGKKMRCNTTTRKKFIDPFRDSPTRTEMENFGGMNWEEVLFVSSNESYKLIRGIRIVTETQKNTFLEKYKSVKIDIPFNRQVPSRGRPGMIDVIKVQNMQYEERSAEVIEEIKKRIKREKEEIKI